LSSISIQNKTALAGKRILFVFCTLELGGAERQGMHLARHLKQQGCDVQVWSNHAAPGLVIEECNEADIPWSVHRFLWPCRKRSFIRDGWRLMRALQQHQPDVVLGYNTWPNIGCGLTWRWSPTKFFIWGQRNVNGLRGHIVERFAYRQASAVICNAKHQVNYLRHTLGKTHALVSIVPNGVKLPRCVKTRDSWRLEFGLSEDATVATMVANFRPVKDHLTLLHAWRKILLSFPKGQKPLHLLLAGARQQSYESVHKLAKDLNLLDTVTFLGQVKDISGLLAASDIGVLTSNHEGMPNAVLEYMAAGLPVVATDLPGIREALGKAHEQQICIPGDPENIASHLKMLIDSPNLRKDLGETNRKRAIVEFSINRMCEKTSAIIADLLAKKQH
jgi:glycosyltransferase involved in cell wall biosynthesis